LFSIFASLARKAGELLSGDDLSSVLLHCNGGDADVDLLKARVARLSELAEA
jgi:hypothetical protein